MYIRQLNSLCVRKRRAVRCCRMSEPESKLTNWCRHLIGAFLATSSDAKNYTAKGLGPSKLASRFDESEEEGGYTSRAEDESEEEVVPELIELIQDFQPSALASGEPLVPNKLPREVRENIFSVTQDQFVDVFKVDTALEKVGKGTITRHELVCMYLKSFRNILHYELSELQNYRPFYDRIKGYCEHVFQDVFEALYPEHQEPKSIVSRPQ